MTQGYITQEKDYWIHSNALSITLNALGNANRIQCSVSSGAVIMAFIDGNTTLGYNAAHNYKSWPLSASPTYFNSNTAKYVYVAIPRTESIGTQAVVVFPSEKLDIDGKNAEDAQIGSTDYLYIYLGAKISATDGTTARTWESDVKTGKLDTAQGNKEAMQESDWYQWSSVVQTVTFLKKIVMSAGSWFQNIRLGDSAHNLTGVATGSTGEEYVNSETLVVTPSYLESKYLSKTHNDTAAGVVTFAQGLVSNAMAWMKKGLAIGSNADSPAAGISENGDAQMNSVSTDNVHSGIFSDDPLSGNGYHVYKDVEGRGHVCTDILDVRMKARFNELEIRRLSYVNAENVQSMAASKVEKVVKIAANGALIAASDTTTTVVAYRCMAAADDGTMATKNGWALGDQARCQTFNVTAPGEYQNVETRLYWRLVVRVGQCKDDGTIVTAQTDLTDYTGKIHHFFDLANIINVTANTYTEFAEFFADVDTTANAYHGMMATAPGTNDVPAADDEVVQMGSQTKSDRMGFFVTRADGNNTGPYTYAGVNEFSLTNHMTTKITPADVLISSKRLKVFSNPNAGDAAPITRYRGDWVAGQGIVSYYYDEWDYNESRWLCIYEGVEGTTEAPGATPARWKEISLKGRRRPRSYTQ